MLKRKVSFIPISLCLLPILYGCNNTTYQYSKNYTVQHDTLHTDVTTNTLKKDVDHTVYSATNLTEIVTTTKPVTTTYVTETTNVTVVETEPIVTQTEEIVYETEVEYEQNNQTQMDTIPDDSLVIHDNAIPLVYGYVTQDMVDAYDVVQDTGLITGSDNTILLGHSNRSFIVLDSVEVGETIILNNYGDTKYYEVQRSELAILNQEGTDVQFLSDGIIAIRHDYGYPALVLVTCANGYAWNYRWIVIAKEIV